MNALLVKGSVRYLLRHPWQLGLAVAGITLGVAVVCAVHLTQLSARQAFAYAQRSVLGDATHQIRANGAGLAELVLRDLGLAFPALRFSPVVEGQVRIAGGNATLRLIGIDPLMQLNPTQAAARLGRDLDPTALMAEPGAAVINAATAARLGLQRGSRVRVLAGAQPRALRIIALAPAAAGARGLADDLAVVDIATAQETLARAGSLSWIDVAADAAAPAVLAALRARLPAGLEMTTMGVEMQTYREMTRAFETNLTALSWLALIVGMFLIYNTETFLIVQRYGLFGRLRALGLTRRELVSMLLLEALVIGVLGSALGLLLGVVLAENLLGLVSRTVNDLYYRIAITEVTVAPAVLGAALVAGISTTLIAALLPALEATRVPVASTLRTLPDAARTRRVLGRLALLSCGCFIASAGLALVPSRSLWLGFALLLLFLVGGALLVPGLLAWTVGTLLPRALPANCLPERLGVRTVGRLGSRTGMAAAALAIAAAASIGIGIMVASFRLSVADWLATLLRADVYVSSTAPDTASGTALAELRPRIAQLPAVAAVSTVKRSKRRGADGTVQLLAYQLPPAARPGFQFIAGAPGDLWRRWEQADVVIVTEPYAYHHHVRPGDALRLQTAAGPRVFRVGGVYRDYASERGAIAMSRATFDRHWQDPGYDGLGVYARAGVPTAVLMRALRSIAGGGEFAMVSNADIRKASLDVFDRTFAVTEVLRTLAVAVAFAGVISALLAQQLERARDYGVLRALGFAAPEICRTVLAQTAAVGFVAACAALPIGIGLAAILIEVINLRSFGWSMALHIPVAPLAQAWWLVIAAAILAGCYPAYRATRIPPAHALRYE